MLTWTVRRFLRMVRSISDRFGHQTRRQAVLDRLRADTKPRSVLVICQGNLCRSPFAAAMLHRGLESVGLHTGVASAGFFGPHRAPPGDALAAAAARGIDMSAHRSQMVNRALLDAADLIVVMEPRQALAVTARRASSIRRVVVLGDLDPRPITTREIADPFGGPRAAFDECYARIDRCVAELVRTLQDRS